MPNKKKKKSKHFCSENQICTIFLVALDGFLHPSVQVPKEGYLWLSGCSLLAEEAAALPLQPALCGLSCILAQIPPPVYISFFFLAEILVEFARAMLSGQPWALQVGWWMFPCVCFLPEITHGGARGGCPALPVKTDPGDIPDICVSL